MEQAAYIENDDSQKDKFLTFHLGEEDYGIEICHVTEIIGIQKITSVPDMPESIRGVINLRGKVIPVMDVRSRFKLESREYDDRTCIVVVAIDETLVGLVVDQVKEVVEIAESQIEPPPCSNSKSSGSYINGMGKIEGEVKILLNVQSLLIDEELFGIENQEDQQ